MNLSLKNYSVRGFLIILVVLGHTIARNPYFLGKNLIYVFIYTFHMPLFLILGGYYGYSVKNKSYIEILKQSCTSLVLPYVIVSFSYQLFTHFLLGTHIHYDIFRDPTFAMWFMLALIFYRLITKVVLKVPYYLFFVLIISIFSIYLPNIVLENFDFSRIFGFMIYYFIGLKLRENDFDCRKLMLRKRHLAILATLSVIVVSYLSINAYRSTVDVLQLVNFSIFRDLTLTNVAIIKMGAILLALLNSILIYSIIKENKVLAYVGENSLFIYLGHIFFMALLKLDAYKSLSATQNGYVIVILICFESLAVIFIILFAKRLFTKYKLT